ncbi:Protein of unknown function (DUF2889) [Frankia sp. EI5c]|uniref:DUF2889 domain-containing protein n=1 Tax=Frankia sp. EI5c TaxID=683316 RepID=UPI0007C28B76|nr:DUF2889 domain-containing protein [Frankia sp. EI5c]OAA23982.1 Protein of unknown function (DUF2889) [Frankia sp. EI5c]
MAHGQTAPTAVQASSTRLTPGRPGPRVPHTGRPRTDEITRHPGSGGGGRHAADRRGAPAPVREAGEAADARAPETALLWPGTTGSVRGTPARRPGSVRRTISVMMERPAGLTGPLHLSGIGRDLLTTRDGGAVVLGEARLRIVLDYMAAPGTVLEIESEPAVPALPGLVGVSTRAGFRSAARRALLGDSAGAGAGTGQVGAGSAGAETARSLLGQLLDDVPVAVLVSGAALGRNGIFRTESTPNAGAESGGNPMLDVCAGWQQDGLLARLSAERRANPATPVQAISVPAGDLGLEDDPQGWHPLPAMSEHAMRRLRRIDVIPVGTEGDPAAAPAATAPGAAPAGAGVRVDALFRDTYLEGPGREVVVHEYGVEADVDGAGLITRSAARAGVLPGRECPEALGSAGRIVGLPAAGLRREVSRTFAGTSTCTHLNDTLRALGDLPDLIACLGHRGDD